MKINLRKANNVQNTVQGYAHSFEIKNSISITQFENADQILTESLATAMAKDTLRDQLTQAVYTIRDLIGQANAASGVDGALTRAAYLDKRIAQLEQFIGSGERVKQEVLNGKLDKLRTRKDDGESRRSLYGYEDSVNTSVFDIATLNSYKDQIKDLKKEKQVLNDKILELNVRTEIELPQDVVDLLNRERLI
jgi:hypothetical protein